MVELIVGDGHTIFVEALVSVLPQQGFDVLGTASSLDETVAAVRRHKPDVCLLDRHLDDGDTIDALGELDEASSVTKVLVLAADGDMLGMRRALRSGASGYVSKMCGLAALSSGIHDVVRGRTAVNLATRHSSRAAPLGDAHRLAAHLTAREWECLGLLVEGARTTVMAEQLGVSPATVRTHVQAVLNKLGVHSRLEAASFALRHRLLDNAGATAVTS